MPVQYRSSTLPANRFSRVARVSRSRSWMACTWRAASGAVHACSCCLSGPQSSVARVIRRCNDTYCKTDVSARCGCCRCCWRRCSRSLRWRCMPARRLACRRSIRECGQLMRKWSTNALRSYCGNPCVLTVDARRRDGRARTGRQLQRREARMLITAWAEPCPGARATCKFTNTSLFTSRVPLWEVRRDSPHGVPGHRRAARSAR